jgi:hypothetical protein
VLFLLALSGYTSAAQSQGGPQQVTRDPQAFSLLQGSAAAMGKTMPADSAATGSVTLVAGSTTDEGTIRILTKGISQTSVQVQTQNGNWSIIYSGGQASRTDGTTATPFSLELAASSQCPYFPLPIIAGILSNQDASY